MNAPIGKFILALAALTLAACAIGPIHDAALDDSRAYVYSVRSDPNVIAYAPVEIDSAVVAIRRADEIAARNGSLNEIHDLAALARDRARLAQEITRTKVAEMAALVERQRVEVDARTRDAEFAQRAAREAQVQADSSRQLAASAQRQADNARLQAAVTQQALPTEGGLRVMRDQLLDLEPRMMDRGLVITLTDIEFDRGAAHLRPAGQQAVTRLAAYLIARPELMISVEGFTDDSGEMRWNQQLSERRAFEVQSALASLGVEPRRIVVHGYGPAYPIAGNDTSAGRQMNSRVEIVVSERGYVTPRV